MTVRLRDVAARAGVSIATASRVLTGGDASGVRAERRAAVIAAARDLRYVPNVHARALAGTVTPHVGAILHDVSDPYFSQIMRGMQRAAADAGRLLTMCNSYRDPERELAYITLLRSQRVEALILTGSGLDDRSYSEVLAEQIGAFAAAGGRPVFIGRHHVAGDAVLPDNVGGARALARALTALGHRRFAIVSGPELLTTTRDRLAGFRAGLAESGIDPAAPAVVAGDFSFTGGARAAAALLDAGTDATCFFALNDEMALGALHALRQRGVAVPEQLSVAGFDDIPAAAGSLPALTTVHLPLEEMGALAVSTALASRGGELRVRHVPATVVTRESVSWQPPEV
jgi:LacI family transcriptional regulator